MARRIVRGRVFFPEFADFLLFGEVTLKVPPFLLRDGCSDALKINICSPSSVACDIMSCDAGADSVWAGVSTWFISGD